MTACLAAVLLLAAAQEETLDLLDGETLYEDGWLVIATAVTEIEEGLLDGRHGESDPLDRRRVSRELWLSAHYGLRHDLQLSALFPFVSRSMSMDNPAGPDRLSADGAGDAVLAAKWRFKRWDGPGTTTNFAAIGGLALPTGEAEEKDEGVVLDTELQPGSGSWDSFVGTAITYEPVRWRVNGVLLYTRNGYGDRVKRGDTIFAELAVGNRFWLEPYPGPFMRLDVAARWRHEAADRRHGSSVSNTGGSRASIATNLAFRPRPSLDFQLEVELPVLESVRGIQLRRRLEASFAFGFRF